MEPTTFVKIYKANSSRIRVTWRHEQVIDGLSGRKFLRSLITGIFYNDDSHNLQRFIDDLGDVRFSDGTTGNLIRKIEKDLDYEMSATES